MLRPKPNKPFNGASSKVKMLDHLGRPLPTNSNPVSVSSTNLRVLKETKAQREAQKFVLVKGKRVTIREYLRLQKLKESKLFGKGALRP